MAAMNTDAAVLAKEAANFERISGELKGVIGQVESTGSALAAQMVGQAGTAAQAALARFHEAAAKQVQELNEISANIHTSGIQYTSTDDDQAGSTRARLRSPRSPRPGAAPVRRPTRPFRPGGTTRPTS